MTKLPPLKRFVNRVYDKYSHDMGGMLLVTGALGWILSSFAHVTAVVINKDIPKEQKKFLIPQEIADAFVNIAAFWVITNQVNKWGTRLVESGRVISPGIKKFLGADLLKKVGTRGFDISQTEAFKADNKFQKEFYKFYDGMDFVSNTLGAVIATNIVTPVLRNVIGARKQKQDLVKQNIYPIAPTVPMYSRVSLEDYKKLSKGSALTSGSSLKI